jgi:arginase
MIMIIPALDVVSCLGGSTHSCGLALNRANSPWLGILSDNLELQWEMIYPQSHGSNDSKILQLNHAISQFSERWTLNQRPFLVIGGDHSCAMGTWAGVLNALHTNEHFGLIWLDAHMDAHTFITSPSKNLHGMPIAALLGKADNRLASYYPSNFFILAKNLKLLGVRSFEMAEFILLHQAKVKIMFAQQLIPANWFKHYLSAAIRTLSQSCETIGISLDLDVIDPEDAPGVETPAAKGIKAKDLLDAFRFINRHPLVCGFEICEYSQQQDHHHKTLLLMGELINSFYGDIKEYKSLGFCSDGIKENSVPN